MNELTDIDIVVIITGRLIGRSWNNLGAQYDCTGQTLRRHIKRTLFPTRKKS
jgi:hypothetical protein